MQGLAEQAAARVISQPATDPAAALVALDPATGQVKAYVGGLGLLGPGAVGAASTSPTSTATSDGTGLPAGREHVQAVRARRRARRRRAAHRARYNAPGSLTIPQPAGQEPWLVNNYDGSGEGRMNLTEATVNSVNTVYAQLVMDLGAQPVVDLAKQMGVRSPLAPVPSAALGSNGVTVLDMAVGVRHARRRRRCTRTRCSSPGSRRRDGTVLYEAPIAADPRALRDHRPHHHRRAAGGREPRHRGERPHRAAGRGQDRHQRRVGRTRGSSGTRRSSSPRCGSASRTRERTMQPPATRITVTGGSWPAQIWQLFAGAALAETPVTGFPAPGTAGDHHDATIGRDPNRSTAALGRWACRSPTRPGRCVDAGYRARLRYREEPRATRRAWSFDQDPPAGRPHPAGTVVTMIVADGPAAPPPGADVLGAYADEAAAALRAPASRSRCSSGPSRRRGARRGPAGSGSSRRSARRVVDEGATVVTITVNP